MLEPKQRCNSYAMSSANAVAHRFDSCRSQSLTVGGKFRTAYSPDTNFFMSDLM